MECQVDPADPAGVYPPSVRNNYKQPATSGDKADPESKGIPVIDVATRSGLPCEDADFYKAGLDTHLGLPTGQTKEYLGDFLTDSARDSAPYKAAGIEYYYWSANSKAFAQAVRGDVYFVLPPCRPINRARAGEGSVWWSYEVPELTRNGRVENIYIVEGEKQINMDAAPGADFVEAVLSAPRKVWTLNDEPLGFPGDERYHYTYPSEPLEL